MKVSVEQTAQTIRNILSEYNKTDWTHIILGIIQTESSFNPLACRYEPHYKWLETPDIYARKHGITKATEEVFQKTSWGLMQVMGAVYRQYGYDKPLNALSCDMEAQLIYGIKHFHRLYSHYKDLYKAILGYNRGYRVKDDDVKLALLSENSYISKVLKNSKRFLEIA